MHDVLKVNMMANIHDENDHIASHTNIDLTNKDFCNQRYGSSWLRKTTTLKNIIKT